MRRTKPGVTQVQYCMQQCGQEFLLPNPPPKKKKKKKSHVQTLQDVCAGSMVHCLSLPSACSLFGDLVCISMVCCMVALVHVYYLCSDCISLRDLKACGHAKLFFNTLFSFNKFLEHEQFDPLSKVSSSLLSESLRANH